MDGDSSGAPDVGHYLSCFPAPPLALGRDSPTTIGRAEENTIVLAESTVSRRHAVVEWKDGGFVVRDAGSRNGILLNGERVEEAALRNDDQIRIGERAFTFLVGEERAVSQHFLHQRRKRHTGGTDIISIATPPRPSGGFAGSLRDFALAELLQALDLGRKTGRVAVVCEDLRGEMLLREGRVVGASLGGLEGEDAAYAMLSLGDGTFDFEARPVEADGGLDASTASLLMEALRRVDEERRAQAEAGEEPAVADDDSGAEEHDPALDTKHGEEPPPEVVGAAHSADRAEPMPGDGTSGGETLLVLPPMPDAEDDTAPKGAALTEDAVDSPVTPADADGPDAGSDDAGTPPVTDGPGGEGSHVDEAGGEWS
ncbi:MAG: FHA domain-containing protein [Planctomycetota bacterium]|jgi:hypothetical protein